MTPTFCDAFPGGIGWIAPEPAHMLRASHAVRAGGGVWLVDPVDGEGVVDRVTALGRPAGVVQLLDRHDRDCAALAARLGVPHHHLPREGVAGAPFQVRTVRWLPGWHELALWFPDERVLACPESLGTAPYFLGPDERLGVHPLMRATPPGVLRGLEPEHVLVGHGAGIHGPDAPEVLERAIASARRGAPAWAWGLIRERVGR